jgi:nucleoside phosphorylase
MMDMEPAKLTLNASRGHDRDVQRVNQSIDFFKQVIVKEKDAAITKSIFSARSDELGADKDLILSSSGRLFSALYMEHYANQNACAVCTGILERGYRENATGFPHYDIPILRYILDSLGYYRSSACRDTRKGRNLEHYGQPEHRRFSYLCSAFVDSLFSMICAQTNGALYSSGAWPSIRAQAAGVIQSEFSEIRGIGSGDPRTIREFLGNSVMAIEKAGERLAKNDTFQRRWRLYVPDTSELRFMVATATDIEDDSVHAALVKAGYVRVSAVSYGKGLAARYTKLGSAEVLVCRSSAGGSGVSGSHLTVSEAVRSLKPRYLIASGICFGFKGGDLKIGDIIVSTSVVNYELVRQGETVRERGDRIPSGPTLLSAARYVMGHRRNIGEKPAAKDGLLLSGEKLVDDKSFVDRLKARFPDALGGEMEAVGLSSSAVADGTEWIVVKAICDWGYEKNKKHQAGAAQNSAEFAVELIGSLTDANTP